MEIIRDLQWKLIFKQSGEKQLMLLTLEIFHTEFERLSINNSKNLNLRISAIYFYEPNLNWIVLKIFQLGWKKYWCVLDGRLLTYYKSKSDYESLCACAGSINLGIATTVRPLKIKGCKGYPIQIITRTQVYYLVCVGENWNALICNMLVLY